MELQTVTLPSLTHGLPVHLAASQTTKQRSQSPLSRPNRESGRPSELTPSHRTLTLVQSSSIIVSVAGITILNTFGQSILIVAIPRIAQDLSIPPSLIQWPTAAGALTLGCLLLVVGAIADVVGNRPVFLTGCLLHLFFGLGCALAQTAAQLIAFRALQGVALALCMPTSVGIITRNFEEGKGRNVAFACFGGGNPIGYAFGLLLGGVFVNTVGWRYGYYFALGLNTLILLIAFFSLPADSSGHDSLKRLKSGVDWVGLMLISAHLSIISYVLASITSTSSLSPQRPQDIALLALALALIPTFILWVGRQEKRGRPAIIPNSLWRRAGFASVCLATFLTWAMFNALAFFATLLMQEIQHITALQTSLRFLPLVILSVSANIGAGYLVDKVAASKLAFGATILSAAAPAVFVSLSPSWSYWAAMFPAICLLPLSSDVLFNVSNLVITATFSASDQALAGGVFNTVSQLGSSIGLAVTAAIASSVTASAGRPASVEAMLLGYRAAFWTCLAAAIASMLISTIGLRKSGKVGLKRE